MNEDTNSPSITNELYLFLGRVEGKLDSVLERQKRSETDHKQLDERVTKLEQHRSWIVGAVAVVGVVGSFLHDKLQAFLFHA